MEPITFGVVINGIFAIAKAVPIFKEWLAKLSVAFIKWQAKEMKQEHREAIHKALSEDDQRPIEEALGNPNAGELSGVPGSEIRGPLPGVGQ